MHSLITITRKALLIGTLLAAQPVLAQDGRSPAEDDTSGEDVIEITPDMAPGSVSRLLNRGQDRRSANPDSDPPTTNRVDAANSAPSVLAILAHPDDEITIAPVLARIARDGGEVTVIFATSGDAGPGVSGLEPGRELGALREDEARCAAFALGLPEPIFWQLGDGALADMARDPDSPARDMSARIASIIDLQKPRIIMTWGPDGGYGHADHRMVSNAVTQIVQAMGADRPDLLYTAVPAGDRADLPGFENWAVSDPALITDRLRYQLADLEATRFAIDCYQSQFDETARAYLPDVLHQNLWQGMVYFRLAFAASS